MDYPKYLTMKEFARITKKSYSTIFKNVCFGILKSIKKGKKRYIPSSELDNKECWRQKRRNFKFELLPEGWVSVMDAAEQTSIKEFRIRRRLYQKDTKIIQNKFYGQIGVKVQSVIDDNNWIEEKKNKKIPLGYIAIKDLSKFYPKSYNRMYGSLRDAKCLRNLIIFEKFNNIAYVKLQSIVQDSEKSRLYRTSKGFYKNSFLDIIANDIKNNKFKQYECSIGEANDHSLNDDGIVNNNNSDSMYNTSSA